MADFEELRAQFREDPLLTALDASLLFGGMLLSVATFLVLLAGLSGRYRPVWYAVIALGVFLIAISNIFYPLLDRYYWSSEESE